MNRVQLENGLKEGLSSDLGENGGLSRKDKY